MEQNHDLSDIENVLTNAMDNPIAKAIRSGSIGALGILHPIAGVAAGIGDNLLTEYNTYKLDQLLKGLSTDLNREKRLNELYNYVNSSQEKAISVANLFRKTVNAECPKVCIIYGLILANHMENNTEFTQDELIVCRALENATECDLKNFKEIMEKYRNGDNIIFPKGFSKLDEFTTTCDWGVYNRLFVSHILEWEDMEDESLGIPTHYYKAKPASVLFEYIIRAHQIWNYRKKI